MAGLDPAIQAFLLAGGHSEIKARPHWKGHKFPCVAGGVLSASPLRFEVQKLKVGAHMKEELPLSFEEGRINVVKYYVVKIDNDVRRLRDLIFQRCSAGKQPSYTAEKQRESTSRRSESPGI